VNDSNTSDYPRVHLGMTLGEYIEIMNQGTIKAPEAATMLGTSKSNVGRKVKDLNYAYDNSAKKYYFIGEEEPPNHLTMEEVLNPKGNKKVTKQVNKSNTIGDVVVNCSNTKDEIKKVEPINHYPDNQLTSEELIAIREIIKERNSIGSMGSDVNSLFERVKSIQSNDKKRNTVIVSDSKLKEFKEFAKTQKLNQYDLLYLALDDFMKKYN